MKIEYGADFGRKNPDAALPYQPGGYFLSECIFIGRVTLDGQVVLNRDLTVAGQAAISGNTTIGGAATIGGNTTITGTLRVGGTQVNPAAQPNNISDANAATLTGGTASNADSLHTHPGLASGGAFESALLHVQYVVAAGTNGGTPSIVWSDRPLNTVRTNEIIGAGLSSSQITLPAGTYWVSAVCTMAASGWCNIRLRDQTNSQTLAVGIDSYAYAVGGVYADVKPVAHARFTLTATAIVSLQDVASNAYTDLGRGLATNKGENEVYADLKIWKLS